MTVERQGTAGNPRGGLFVRNPVGQTARSLRKAMPQEHERTVEEALANVKKAPFERSQHRRGNFSLMIHK
jgi:hypothetical protein